MDFLGLTAVIDSIFLLVIQSKIDFTTNRVFRDTSAFYHIVVALDIDNATSTERFKNVYKWRSRNKF